MKTLTESPRKQRTVFFITGMVFALICGVIQFEWMNIVPYRAFDQQPEWLKGLSQLVGWLPWIVLVAILVLRLVKGRSIRVGFYFLGTAMPTVAIIGWMLFGISIGNMLNSQKFNPELWQNHKTVEHDNMWPPRLTMVDDLMTSGKLEDLNKNQVMDILGSPTEHGYFKKYDLVYWLGPERGFIRIDSEWLAISFGENGKVNKYVLVRD